MLDLSDEEIDEVVALAARAEADDLSRCFQGFSNAFDDIVRSDQPRMALEMALVRLARRPPLLPLDELLSRVAELERRLSGVPPSGAVPRGGSSAGGRGMPIVSAPPETPVPRTHGTLALADSPPVVAPPPDASLGLAEYPWRAILDRIRTARPALASVLEHAVPLHVTPVQVTIGLEPGTFLLARASERESFDLLTREVRAHFGAPTRVTIDSAPKPAAGTPLTVASVDAERRTAESARMRSLIQTHPIVEEAVRLFGAKVQDVRLPTDDG
jgi:DNA polymerase-3 subunit gamma/tau